MVKRKIIMVSALVSVLSLPASIVLAEENAQNDNSKFLTAQECARVCAPMKTEKEKKAVRPIPLEREIMEGRGDHFAR